MEVRGRRATVMGLGRHGGGVAVARWLAEQGAIVTVTDTATPEALADSIRALADVDIAAWHLGGHLKMDFENVDLLVVNPAVRLGNPLIDHARATGATITSELELFLERCPCQMIGVTGSNGKSTTAAMIAAILGAEDRQVFLGGNIGRSLLADLANMTRESWAVLEISSFQLAWLSDDCPLPHVAVLTNFAPNHLDWHGTLADYATAKQRLFYAPRGAKMALFGEDSQQKIGLDRLAVGTPDRLLAPWADEQIPTLRVPGAHNRRNAACAAAVAAAVGCSPAAIGAGLREFAGLEHRLEFVGSIAGRDFYNDSMATTPESTAAALVTFSRRAWLLAGGYDKHVDMAALVDASIEHAQGAALYGAIGPRLHAQIAAKSSGNHAYLAETLAAAFDWCWRRSRAGDCLILSPGCASYDQFADYRERGAHFRALVRELAAAHDPRETVARPADAR